MASGFLRFAPPAARRRRAAERNNSKQGLSIYNFPTKNY